MNRSEAIAEMFANRSRVLASNAEFGADIKSGWVFESAKSIAVSMAKEWPEVTHWKPLDDLAGVLSQISNMTAGMKRVYSCGNKFCGWQGLKNETYMLGEVGPLCPRCKEIAD